MNSIIDFKNPELYIAFFEERPRILKHVKDTELQSATTTEEIRPLMQLFYLEFLQLPQQLNLRLLSVLLFLSHNGLSHVHKLDLEGVKYCVQELQGQGRIQYRLPISRRMLSPQTLENGVAISGYQTL
jgi:hypothetical protein